MSDLLQRLAESLGLGVPPYGMGAILLLILYTIQSELRFGPRARSARPGPADRGSTRAVSLSAAVPVLGFVLAQQPPTAALVGGLAAWLVGPAALPGMPALAWAGLGLGAAGLLLRLWAVLVLRQRYTRTLLVHEEHLIERGGPYRFVRHPGYLGSLLVLNGIALASGSTPVFGVSFAATAWAYAYRIRVEDEMLTAAFGAPYEEYCREVGALLPFVL
jgi:protein-S-isoprenylcysteine O-methyltransferase